MIMYFNELPQASGFYLTNEGLRYFDAAMGFLASYAVRWWAFDFGNDLD